MTVRELKEALDAHLDDMKVRVFTLDCHAEGMD